MTGMDLRIERIRARVTLTDLAREIGISRQRLNQIEDMERVPEPQIARYRSRLAALRAAGL